MKKRKLCPIDTCRECGSKDLKWHSGVENRGGVQDGMISMRETNPIFFLGCGVCYETVFIVDGDKVADYLNEIL